ncbi:hypothetical protein FFF34_011660 [Inquilinus sp. KBS0705]|nr:hypothetical protein FFF34_011660 [Inquilinus sp. KBS0705]
MPNIKFSYLYRDSSNYKNFGFIVFDNSCNISLEGFEAIIRSKLIDDTWFYASEWGLSNLYFDTIDIEADPTWHEFESVEYTEDTATNSLSISSFYCVDELMNNVAIFPHYIINM